MSNVDPHAALDALTTKIERGERGGSEADREVLLETNANMELIPSEVGAFRRLKILRHCTRMAEEVGGLAEAMEDREAAEEIVRWIHRNYENEQTNADYRTVLRSLGRYYHQTEEPPDSLDWIPTGTSSNYDPTPSERDLITRSELQAMLDVCQNARDEALIALQFEAGCRSGELWDLKRGDVFDGEHTKGIHVDGKEGERAVHLIVSIPYLQRWLERQPTEDPNEYLWTKLDTLDRPSYNGWLGIFKRAADRAGVKKEVNPTMFRKANTRWLVTIGMSQARIEDRQGRKRGSEHTARYMARFGKESNERAYARLHGLDVEVEDEGIEGPIECPRCHRETPSDREYCMWCDFGLSHDAIAAVEDQEDRFFEAAVQAEDEELIEASRMIRQDTIRYPGIRRVTLDE